MCVATSWISNISVYHIHIYNIYYLEEIYVIDFGWILQPIYDYFTLILVTITSVYVCLQEYNAVPLYIYSAVSL